MRRGIRRAPAWLALVLSLALVAAACGGDEDEPDVTGPGETGPEPTGETTTGPTGGSWSLEICEPESLIPQVNAETCGSQVLKALFTPLITFTPEDEVVFTVAESIESEDNVNWTVTLREGWTFHDGTPVTAQSFVDAWNWGAYGPNGAGNNYFFGPFGVNIVGYDELNPSEGDPETDQLSGLQVVDDRTFTVELGAPFSEFPITVGYNAFYALPESFFDDPEAWNESPVGNGPYMMDGSWEHDVGINVVRYEDYAGEPGNADSVEFRIYADPDTAYRDVQAGNLDIMTAVPPEQIEAAQGEFGDRFLESPSSSFSYIGLPQYVDQLQNADLRKALSLAIDRQAVIDAIYFGTLTPADDMVSPVVQGYREGVCQYCVFDPEQAQQLFDAAGGFDGTLEIWFNNDGGHEEWIEAVANMWRQTLGIEDITFESMPFARYLGRLDQGLDDDESTPGVTGPFRLGWVMDYPSMQNYLENLHGTEAGSNYTTYSNTQFDDLIAQGKSASTLEEAVSFYQQADDLILEDMPIIPLWFGLGQTVHNETVSNIIVDKFTFVDVAAVQVAG
ncbi:MAG TPA: ABC transporter substrate-binding protein [Actinomycetota bacterium]|nr:ABC transporter substrate-binding protein [Actinomycetota bacterium]